jgi:hypothetical protein
MIIVIEFGTMVIFLIIMNLYLLYNYPKYSAIPILFIIGIPYFIVGNWSNMDMEFNVICISISMIMNLKYLAERYIFKSIE